VGDALEKAPWIVNQVRQLHLTRHNVPPRSISSYARLSRVVCYVNFNGFLFLSMKLRPIQIDRNGSSRNDPNGQQIGHEWP
jgi:hypothetical protein